MTKQTKAKAELRGKARMRSEIVEAKHGLHKVGAVSDAALAKTTIRMLGKEALPKIETLSAVEIAAVREEAGVSQAVMAAFLNVAVSTVSQWERGERHPTGAALKLLHVVKRSGIEALQ